MSNFLLENQKEKYRLKIDDNIYLLEPTNEQKVELSKIIESNVKIEKDLEMNGTVPIDSIRFIFRELTSIGDEIDNMTDEEISNAIDNGNRKIVELFRAIKELLDELLADLQYSMEQQINLASELIGLMNITDSTETIENELKKFNEKNNKDLTVDDITNMDEDEILNKIK